MTVGTYAARVTVHPERYGSKKSSSNLWAVLHTSEGSEGHASAEALAAYLGAPGDRPNGRGGMYGSSYHAIFDTDRIIPAVPYDTVAYSAGGGNARGIHACFPGKAGQTRDQWLDPVSRAMIQQAAAWLVDIEDQFGIPVAIKMTVPEMQQYRKGLADHYMVSLAFRKSTHTDVGPGFPWDVLAADIRSLRNPFPPPTNPPQEDDTVFVAFIKHAAHNAVYKQWSNGTKTWVRDEGTFTVEAFLRGKTVPQLYAEVRTMPNDSWMQASGPIVGPTPPGVDPWGCP